MNAEKATKDDVANGLSIFRAVVQTFDQRVSQLLEGEPTDGELNTAMRAIQAIISVAYDCYDPPHTSKKPPRGRGYGDRNENKGAFGVDGADDAMIVASLPWYDNNLTAAICAHLPWLKDDPEKVQVHARRIRERKREIEDAEGNVPWETSSNWLGDLIAEQTTHDRMSNR